jgi:CDP-diacylglycerol pyrophosphatase
MATDRRVIGPAGKMPRPMALMAVGLLAVAPVADAHGDREALWRVVHDQCVPDQLSRRDPGPCTEVNLDGGEARGSAVLKDSEGPDQFLLIPTARVTGIEDPAVRTPGAPNYFEYAWRARAYTEAEAGGVLPRDWISLAVNSVAARTQDQLHIHIDCLRADVHRVLADAAGLIGPAWAPLPVPLAGDSYQAVAIESLDSVNPFALATDSSDAALSTVVVVGAGTDEDPGFVVLRRTAPAGSEDPAAGENLQDHDSCPAPVAPGPFTGK